MGDLFSMDNPVFHTIGKFCDIICLSLLYIILCIPIVTIGPATTALYYTIVKVIRRERGYIGKEFFHSFKDNFKTGSLTTIILVAAFSILYIDFQYALYLANTKNVFGYIMCAIFGMIAMIFVCITIYIFPVLSRFTIKGKQLFKTSLFLAIRHLPNTFVAIAVTTALGFLLWASPISIAFAPALMCLVLSFPMEKVLKKYIKGTGKSGEDSGIDEWYLE